MPVSLESIKNKVRPLDSPLSPDVLAKTINKSALAPSITKVFLAIKTNFLPSFYATISVSSGL